VRVEWNRPAEAASFNIYRQPHWASGGIGDLVGSTTETSFDDTTGTPFAIYDYTVEAVSADGHAKAPFFDRDGALATSPSDQVNLGPVAGSASSMLYLQTFTPAVSGLLGGIELPARAAGTIAVRKGPFRAAVAPPSPWSPPLGGTASAPLAPDEVLGLLYDFSGANLIVAAGETLTLEVETAESAPVSGDVYAGGAGAPFAVPDPAHDLLFKTFVMPAGAGAMSADILGGDRSLALIWSPVSGAATYEIRQQGADALAPPLLSTAATWGSVPVAAGEERTLFVVARSADRELARSGPVTAAALAAVIDQQNTGGSDTDAPAGGFVRSLEFSQSFTVGSAGTLDGVEFAPRASSDFAWKAELYDDAGALLGTVTVRPAPASIATGIAPLTTPYRSGAFADFSALGLSVSPGMKLRVRLTFPVSGFIRDTSDRYAGGEETGPQTTSARDLVFRTWVRP